MTSLITTEDFSYLMTPFQTIVSQSKIAVAVSGGPDSLCLAILLSQWARNNNVVVACLIVDHQLRTESTHEAEITKHQLQQICEDVTILTWHGMKPKTKIQEHARHKRYELLTTWCLDHNYDHLFIAHHIQDQQETSVWRLMRGSDLWGLAGMSAQSYKNGITLCRPLLTISKERLLATLASTSFIAVQDPSNHNDSFARVAVRKRLSSLPTMPIMRLGYLRQSFDLWLTTFVNRYVQTHSNGYLSLNRDEFIRLSRPFQAYLLVHLLKVMAGLSYPPRRQDIETLITILLNQGVKSCTLGGCVFLHKHLDIIIVREWQATPMLNVDVTNKIITVIWDNNFHIKMVGLDDNQTFTIKSLGRQGWQQLCHQQERYDIDQLKTIPYAVRLALPALWHENQLRQLCHNYGLDQPLQHTVEFQPKLKPHIFMVLPQIKP